MKLTHLNGSWPWPLRICHVQMVMGVLALVSFLLLFSSLGGKSSTGDLIIDGNAVRLAGRKMSAMDENAVQYDGTESVTPTPTTTSLKPKTKSERNIQVINNDVVKLLDGQPTVEIYKLAPRKYNSRLNHHYQEVLQSQMRTQGFIIPAPPGGSSSFKGRNRTVTEDDIKRTLDILDQKLDQGQKEIVKESTGSHLAWNTSAPQRIMLVTSWRSGSTFLGQILSDHPGVFNHYEPLMHADLKQIRGGEEAEEAVQHLRDLLHCKYKNENYIHKIRDNMSDMVSHNVQVWEACVQGPNRNTCSNTTFLQQACNRFPIIASKIVRLRLNLTRQLLEDPSLPDLKILYLVRDPRATMNSRLSSVKWCSSSPDCINAGRLCNDLHSDLDAFEALSQVYPSRVALIKYETLANMPQMTFRAIFDFAGLTFTRRIQELVLRHTSRNEEQPWSTVRKSSERVNLWKAKLSKEKIADIQLVCASVLARLGYQLV